MFRPRFGVESETAQGCVLSARFAEQPCSDLVLVLNILLLRVNLYMILSVYVLAFQKGIDHKFWTSFGMFSEFCL